MKYKFVEVEGLFDKCKEANYTVVVFGTLECGMRVRRTLDGFGIKVAYYGDNNPAKQGLNMDGLQVISATEVAELNNPLVVIGSFWYQSISEQLSKLGVSDIYVLEECLASSYEDMEADRDELGEYFDNYDMEVEKSSNILVEIYGHLGDVFVRTGVIKTLIENYGKENVYILVDVTEQKALATYLRLISNNVIELDSKLMVSDRSYRIGLLKELNSKYFRFSCVLCDRPVAVKMRCLNKYILNVRKIHLADVGGYVLEKEYKILSEIFHSDMRKICEKNNNISDEISQINMSFELPSNYIAVNMGAANYLRRYPVEKFRKVFDYLVAQNYNIVFLGHGDYDEKFYSELIADNDYGTQVISLVSKLSILESLYVISKSDFFVGTESGLYNAAFILGKKAVCIYGKGDWGHFMHSDSNMHYVVADMERCEYCKFWNCKGSKISSGVAECVEGISGDKIIEAIEEVMNTRI